MGKVQAVYGSGAVFDRKRSLLLDLNTLSTGRYSNLADEKAIVAELGGDKDAYSHFKRYLREFVRKGIFPFYCDELAGEQIFAINDTYEEGIAALKKRGANTPSMSSVILLQKSILRLIFCIIRIVIFLLLMCSKKPP